MSKKFKCKEGKPRRSRRPKVEDVEEARKAKKAKKEVALMIDLGHKGSTGQLPSDKTLLDFKSIGIVKRQKKCAKFPI